MLAAVLLLLGGGVFLSSKKDMRYTSDDARWVDLAVVEKGPLAIFSEQPSELTLMIGGDVMFDRKIRVLGEKNGYDTLLAPLSELFSRADIAVVNLEGPITSNPSQAVRADGTFASELVFTFAPETALALARANIDLVSLANNHTDNFGREGIRSTHQYVEGSGVGWFGDPANISGTEAVITKNDIPVAFVGYHAFQSGFSRILDDVRRLAGEGYFVVVMPHWGPEYVSEATDEMRAQALDLVNAGARLIVGAHPHVVMNREWVRSVPVFYSIGNLLFDQYFSPEVMKGNIVEVVLEKNKTTGHISFKQIYIHETSLTSRTHVELVQ